MTNNGEEISPHDINALGRRVVKNVHSLTKIPIYYPLLSVGNILKGTKSCKYTRVDEI